MKSNILILSLFSLFSFLISTINSAYDPLTPTELMSTLKLSGYTISPNGDYVIYGVKKWNKDTGKSYTHLQYKNINTNIIKNLTQAIEGQTDTAPVFSKTFPDYLFFQRSNSDIKTSIYYIKFPPEEETEKDLSVRLTEYPLPIYDFKIKSKTIAFSTDVYFECKNMNCSAEKIEQESKQNYQVYTKLFMFHWDTWLVEGKGSHVFIQKFDYDNEKKMFVLINEPVDVCQGMEVNTPPLFTDYSNYDLSNDGNLISFSAHLRNNEEAFSTAYKTYYQNLNTMKKPVCITDHTNARTQNPVFSNDDTKIAYLAMKIPGLESEILHFEIYNILTNKLTVFPNNEELSIQSFIWDTDSKIIFYANSYQANKLFTINLKNITNPLVELFPVKYNEMSYSLPIFALNNKNIALLRINAYDFPEQLEILKRTENSENAIIILNEEFLKTKSITKAEAFNFTGGYGDQVYGFFLKPINFDSSKTYPVVVLIHGGPEGSWTHAWGTSWNPQMYTNQGYAVIMINPHGSVGFGDKFQDDVRNNWGGVPFEDIILGVNFILNKYNYLDKTRMCAAGGSYGGYMINWIEGHNDKNETLKRDWTFNCLANHDGIFSHISMFYSTEEIWFPKEEFCDKQHKGCNPWEGPEIRKGFDTYSTERYVKNWHTPMIIIHGGTDYRVPLTEALSAFTALQLKGVPSEFFFLHQENHWVLKAENQIKWFDEVYKFFDYYTKSNEYEVPEEAEVYKKFNKNYNY